MPYEIPENYLPDGYRCLKVFVPDDEHYLDQFWTAYEYFCQWTAWEREALKRGRQVALKWRTGFDMARDIFIQFGGCEMAITAIRQNPANPCDIQVQTDSSTTWVSTIDISKCNSGSGGLSGLSNLTIENNIIVGTDQCGDQVALGPASDPKHSSVYTPAYPSANPGDQCNAGANAAQYLSDQINHWADIRVTLVGIYQWVINIVEALSLFVPETAWTAPIYEFFQQTADWVQTNWENLQTYDAYDELRILVTKFYSADGSMSKAQWETLIEEMQTQYVIPSTTDHDRAWFIATYIANNLGSVGMARIANSMGITDADCTDVEWSQSFEFASSMSGFTGIRATGETTAQYVQYAYWKQVQTLFGGAYQTWVAIYRRGLAPFTLTHVEFTYDAVPGELPGDGPEAFVSIHNTGGDHTFSQELITEAVTDRTLAHSDVWTDVDAIEINVHTGSDATLPVGNGGNGKIKRVTIKGTGLNPFE
jgi:hypothetical protein